MQRFLTGPWLPTAAFAALSLFDVLAPGSFVAILRTIPIVTAVIVVPLAWRAFVLRPGRPSTRRAVLAGATAALLISISMPLLASIIYDPRQPHTAGSPASPDVLDTILVIWGATFFAAPVGALLGALVEVVRKRSSRGAAAGLAPHATKQEGALGGAMVAILSGPVLSILAVALLPLHLKIVTSAMHPAGRLFATWLVLIPIGAWAGAWVATSQRKPAEGRPAS